VSTDYDYPTDNRPEHWSERWGANGSWEWSGGRWVLLDDGITDTRDVGAASDDRYAVETADYWAMAAEIAAHSAGISLAQAELADAAEETPHSLAVLEEAGERHAEALAVLDEVQDIRTEVRTEAGLGTESGAVYESVPSPDAATVAAIFDYLYSQEHAEDLSEEEFRHYVEGVGTDAEQMAEAGYTAEQLHMEDQAIQEAAELGEDLDAAGQIAVEDDLLALAEMERLATQQEATDAASQHEAFVERHGLVRELYDELYDAAEYARVEGDGAREDAYCDGVWDHAEALVDAGATAEEYRLAAEWATDVEAEVDPDSWAALNPNAEWAAGEDEAARYAGQAFTAAVDGQLAEHGREPAAPGATDEALADLLYELDQARCARDADETPEEDRHGWEQQVEYFEEQVTLAEGTPHDEVYPATPQTVDGSDAEAWGVPDGTSVDELPQTYDEWAAEGVEVEPPLASEVAVAEAHAAVEASVPQDTSDDAPVAETVPALADVDE
jgi:hypothetical protein